MPGQSSSHIPPLDEGRQRKTSVSHETRKPVSRLSAGDLSLDFMNTMHPDDFLRNAADLLRWSRDVGLVTEEWGQKLLTDIDAYPEESSALFTQAITLREASYRVLLALIYQRPPDSSAVNVLQHMFVQARSHERLVPTDDHLVWQWELAESGLAGLHWSLSRSAEILLTSSLMERVKECPPAKGGCGWLFVDRSKNRSRQWCSDEDCGSRIRMRRLYARKRAN